MTAFNGLGIESNATTGTFTIADDPVKSTELNINGVTMSDVETYGTTTGKIGNYVKFTNKTVIEDEFLCKDFAEFTGSGGVLIDGGDLQITGADINVQGELKGNSLAYSYYNSAATTLTTSYATVNLDTLQGSTGLSGISISSNVVTVNRTGDFLITMDIVTETTLGGNRSESEAQLYKNGTAVTGTLVKMYNRTNNRGATTGSATTVISVNSGDTFEIKAKQTGTDTIETIVGGTRLTLMQVGY